MWDQFIRFVLRYKPVVLVIIAVFTAFMAYHANNVRLSYEFAQMLPEKDSTFRAYTDFKERFGQDGSMMVIGVDDPALLDINNFNKWYELSNEISTIKEVDSVISLAHVYRVLANPYQNSLQIQPVIKSKPGSQQALDSLLEEIYRLPFYEGLLYTSDTSDFFTLMGVTLDKEIINSKSRGKFVDKVYQSAHAFSKDTGIELHYSGLPYIRTYTMAKIKRELTLFIILAAVVLGIILFLFFRSFKAVFVSLLIVGISVIWVFGTLTLFGYEITILTGLIPPLIIVIGIPNCIFLFNKYHLEYKKHGNKILALSRGVKRIGNAILMTNMTTAAGFATFILTRSNILVEFGQVASLNIMGLFVLSITIIPVFFSYVAPPSARHTKHLDNQIVGKAIEKLTTYSLNHRTLIYLLTTVFVGLCIYGITKVKTTGRLVGELPEEDPIYQDMMFFERHVNGVLPFEIEVDTKEKNGIFANGGRSLYKIRKLEKIFMEDSLVKQYFSRPLSIADAVCFAYQAHKGGDPRYYRMPPPLDMNRMKSYAGKMTDDHSQFQSYIDSNKQVTRISVQMKNIGTNQIQKIKDYLEPKINDLFPPDKYDVILTGTSVVFLKGTNFLIKNLFISLGLAVLLISLFIAWMFSSYKMVVIYLIPNIIPLLFTAGIMGYFNIPLKPSTILVFSIAFGIAVDNSIHFLAKYRQELRFLNWDIRKSVLKALRETGISMMYTSTVLFFGFAIFIASGFGGTKALGILVSITLFVALLTNLILLPSLLLTMEKRISRKEYKEPMIPIYDDEEEKEENNGYDMNINKDGEEFSEKKVSGYSE